MPKSNLKRLLWVALGVFFLFGLLLIQFFKLQIIDGDKWVQEGRKQHYFIIKEPFKRGTFYSNTSIKKGHPEKSQPFVLEVEKFHLYIDPFSIPDENRGAIADQLLAVLNLSVEEQPHFRAQFDSQSRSRKLAMWLDRDLRDAILTWWNGYARENEIPRNALFFISDYQRSYPYSKLLGQVLHTVQLQKDETTRQALPTGGLELYFDSYLQGKQGKRRLMRSPRNSLEIGEVISKPENGADIYLTINHVLQAIAEEELEKGVKKVKAASGWAVMMNPYTGEIYALAQYPFFNPEEYTRYFNDPRLIENTKVKAITDANEPGSIMKALTITIALLANDVLKAKGQLPIFDPDAKMATDNSRFPGRSKPLTDTHFHRFLNMNMAVQKSSNIYPARLVEKIIERLGNMWYRNALETVFGMGMKTGIELPAESAGVLPMPGKLHPNGRPEWSTPTPFSMAMGHNIQVTSLQILIAYAAIANGGYHVQPTLVRKIIKTLPDGTETILLDNTHPDRAAKFPKVLDEKTLQRIVTALRYVTKPGGTSRRADIPGYTEAGKTGTSMKAIAGGYANNLYVSSFVGFAPVEHPEFVLVVTVDEPWYGYIPGIGLNHHGGTCCAPIFREIARRSLEYLGIPPDDPFGYPVADPRYNAEKAKWVKEMRQLQEMYEKWNK
jgi:cell division protein FtsI (penicillin-binding protein 3)